MLNPKVAKELDSRLKTWRESLAVMDCDESVIDELECHLRDLFEERYAVDGDVDLAWQNSFKAMGPPNELAAEFAKLEKPSRLDRTAIRIVCGLGALCAAVLALFGFFGAARDGGGALLASHVALVTLGYSMALALSVVGLFLAIRRLSGASWAQYGIHPLDLRDLKRVFRAGFAAITAFVGCGLILGAIWAREALGEAWSFDPRELGAVAVLCYHAGLGFWITRWDPKPSVLLAIAAGGGALTLTAWFGVHLLVNPDATGIEARMVLASFIMVFVFCGGNALWPQASAEHREIEGG